MNILTLRHTDEDIGYVEVVAVKRHSDKLYVVDIEGLHYKLNLNFKDLYCSTVEYNYPNVANEINNSIVIDMGILTRAGLLSYYGNLVNSNRSKGVEISSKNDADCMFVREGTLTIIIAILHTKGDVYNNYYLMDDKGCVYDYTYSDNLFHSTSMVGVVRDEVLRMNNSDVVNVDIMYDFDHVDLIKIVKGI